ncbi:MAG: peptidoglycan-associated lipoprotein Pal [Nitrospirota bacterium]
MKKLIIVLLLITTVGCAKKYTKPAETTTAPESPVREEVVKEDIKPEQVETMRIDEGVSGQMETSGQGQVAESTMSSDDQAKSVFKDVLFDYDKYDIRPDARPVMDAVAAYLSANKGINIVVEGHCDERGTNEYNLALGEKRAKSAKNYLTSLGVSPDRMIVITFGEEKPVCTDQNESCWQMNRRAHFVIVKSRFEK